MEFNNLLVMSGYGPQDVALMLHTPAQAHEKKTLLALADEYPDLFEVYQDNHPPLAEATLKRRKFAASFVVGANNEAHFVGMYRVAGWRDATALELDSDLRRISLRERYNGRSFAELAADNGRDGRAIFDLNPMAELSELRGRVVTSRPPGRNYMRLAENTLMPVLEIRRESRLAPPPPEWRDFIVTVNELLSLPRDWASQLAGWRGVYLITDEKDGARYVGSAYGVENLLGRWRAHVASERGVTAELGRRETGSFRFSILQLLLHDAEATEVQELEANWKTRLHTREWGLNRN